MYPIKAGNISQEDDGIICEIYYFNLMVPYLYSFNLFISLNEIGKYLNRSIVLVTTWTVDTTGEHIYGLKDQIGGCLF